MKLTILFLTVGLLNVSAKGVSQNVTFSGESVSLESVFTSVRKQTGFLFLYTDPMLRSSRPVTISANNLPLEKFLEEIFRNQPLKYSINGKTIFISEKATGSFESKSVDGFHPFTLVHGRILANDGTPLVGASVLVMGTKNSTFTSVDGVFSLNVNVGDVLLITFVGYQSTEYKITSAVIAPSDQQSTPGTNISLTITLKRKESQLDEVVVNKGYYSEFKKFSTGNTATITSKEIEQQPVQNPLLALEGRVPGLVVTQLTGMNGGAVQVRIQGQNSFNSGLDPLIVIDGIPYPSQFPSAYMETIVAGGSPLNYINTSDIESISVLKDADATAIYGSKAANGAILITTKKAKAGKPKLSIDLQQGWGKVTRFAKMMNTRQYLDMRYEAYRNDGIDLATQSVGYNNYDLKLWDTTRYTNWQKELIGGTAQYTTINASISGGTNTVQYLIGANYNRQTTVFSGNFDNKASGLHFNINGASPNQRLRIQLSGSYTYNENRLPNTDLTYYAVLLEPDAPKLYNDNGTLNWETNVSGSSTWNNPLAYTLYSEFSNTTKNVVSSMNIGYTILPGLVLSSNLGYSDLRSDLFKGFKLEYVNPESRPYFQRQATFGTRDISSWIIEPQLQFNKIVKNSKWEVLVGTTIQKSKGNYFVVDATGQPTDELLHTLTAATSVRAAYIGPTADYVTRFNGLYGRINYNLNKKYVINLTGRRDGSSKFGDGNKFHNFWSTGVGWIFSEEKWIQTKLPFLSFGKLRASYGTTGNDQIPDYSYLSLYNITSSNILYQGGTGFIINGLSNPLLQWEETRKLQGGIDLSILNERIALSATYARNRSSNQLINYTLPDVTGFTFFTKNFPATIQNTSWEFSLNTINVKSKNFNWTTNVNLTIPHNKVTSFPGIELTSYAGGTSGVIVGEPIGIKKVYQNGGVDPATGNYFLLDTTGKAIDPNVDFGAVEQSAKISLLPKYYGGISNTISYKGFQLDFLFQFVYQMGSKDLFYKTDAGLPPGSFYSGYSNQPVSVLNRWQKPGDNATIGRFTTDYGYMIWPYYYTDAGYSYSAGSYIRLKNVSLSWQLPENWTRKAHLQTTRIYFRGQNLATISKYKGMDPESRSMSTLPPLQVWTVGAKIEL